MTMRSSQQPHGFVITYTMKGQKNARNYWLSCCLNNFFRLHVLQPRRGKKVKYAFMVSLEHYSNHTTYICLPRKYAAVLQGKTEDLYVLSLYSAHQFQLMSSIAVLVRTLWNDQLEAANIPKLNQKRANQSHFKSPKSVWLFQSMLCH